MDINEVLGSFSENQLKQINRFIGSARGRQLADSLAKSDKSRLIEQLGGLDADTIRRRLSALSIEDIQKILK